MTATLTAAPAQPVLDELARLLRRHREGGDVGQLLDDLATVLRHGRAALRRAARKDDGRDEDPTAAVKHPAPSYQQESRPDQGRSDTPDTPVDLATSSQMGAVNRDESGGRGAHAPTAAPTRATARPEQATPQRVSGVVAPVGKPATITLPARIPPAQATASAVAGREDRAHGVVLGLREGVQAPGELRVVSLHAAQDGDRQSLEVLGHGERRRWQVLVGHEPARDVLNGPVSAGGVPPQRVAVALAEVGLHEPKVVRPWTRTALAGVAQLLALVVGLVAVLLGASSAGEVAPADVVPATAVGAALLAGLVVGRVTAPAIAGAITRLRKRARTAAPTRAPG